MPTGHTESDPKRPLSGAAGRRGIGGTAPCRAKAERSAAGQAPSRRGRGPRAEEFALMRSLLEGPRPVTAGPIGQCVKRGWCRAVVVEPPTSEPKRVRVVFALTDGGRDLVADPVTTDGIASGPTPAA